MISTFPAKTVWVADVNNGFILVDLYWLLWYTLSLVCYREHTLMIKFNWILPVITGIVFAVLVFNADLMVISFIKWVMNTTEIWAVIASVPMLLLFWYIHNRNHERTVESHTLTRDALKQNESQWNKENRPYIYVESLDPTTENCHHSYIVRCDNSPSNIIKIIESFSCSIADITPKKTRNTKYFIGPTQCIHFNHENTLIKIGYETPNLSKWKESDVSTHEYDLYREIEIEYESPNTKYKYINKSKWKCNHRPSNGAAGGFYSNWKLVESMDISIPQ